MIKNILKIKTQEELLRKALWLEGKTLAEIVKDINLSDKDSRVTTKGNVGYVIENGFFGVKKNSDALPDIPHLGIEIKTSPLKYNSDRTKLTVKEPLSLNIINYFDEAKCDDIKDSSLYKKNKTILFVFYIHDNTKLRSQYEVKYVFLWHIDDAVLNDLRPDYKKIQNMILEGRAHEIHQYQHEFLTLCPKHNGTFNDPSEMTSKRKQPFSELPAEVRAFRIKNSYMNMIICKNYGFIYEKGGWKV